MATHHPPRHCFLSTIFDDGPMSVLCTFTEQRKHGNPSEVYEYIAPDTPSYAAFKAHPTGHWFDTNVRHNSSWTFARIS